MTTIYRDWTIEWCPYQGGYEAVSPNYEPVWLGEEDGWLDGDRFTVDTLEQAYAEIDDRIDDANYQADCAGDAEHERRRHEED